MLESRYIRLVIWVLFLIFTSSLSTFGQEEILKNLQSDNLLQRQNARKALTGHLEKLDESNHSVFVSKLLETLLNPATNYQLKLGICYSLGEMKKVPWKVANQQEAEKNMYDLFRGEKDYTLKVKLDDALMTAAGLYWDAINDYNNGRVDQIEVTSGKFRRVFETFPESSYASKAHFFLANYYTRVYFILKNRNMNPPVDVWIEEKSNAIFRDFISKVKNHTYKSERLQEARYFLALNYVLLKKFKDAGDCLNEIISDPMAENQSIYVYQFYYSLQEKDIVDDYFAPKKLAQYTEDYLIKHPVYNNSYLDEFVAYLKGFK
ncbi:MAG TPA: hypothetical protein VK469_18495 [Candidatus Kapabacteria bacterium]|nr:hypothetical protein [Candidatus Kapabacteria bacterium]